MYVLLCELLDVMKIMKEKLFSHISICLLSDESGNVEEYISKASGWK